MGEKANTLVIGKIVGCFGIKGWVKVHAYTDPVESFLTYEGCTVKAHSGRPGAHDRQSLVFDAGHKQGKGLVAHIQGVDDRTLAESFKGLEIEVSASKLPRLEAGEYYWRQLQGLHVWCRDADAQSAEAVDAIEPVLLGVVDHLIETGANDVLVVKSCEGSYDQKERLIPYLPGAVVSRVDLEKQIIEVDWFLEF